MFKPSIKLLANGLLFAMQDSTLIMETVFFTLLNPNTLSVFALNVVIGTVLCDIELKIV